jgi:hypothetical protein
MKIFSLLLIFTSIPFTISCETTQEVFERGREAIDKISEKKKALKVKVEILEQEEKVREQKNKRELKEEKELRKLIKEDGVWTEAYQQALELKAIEEAQMLQLKHGRSNNETSAATWFVCGIAVTAISLFGAWFLSINSERNGYASLIK